MHCVKRRCKCAVRAGAGVGAGACLRARRVLLVSDGALCGAKIVALCDLYATPTNDSAELGSQNKTPRPEPYRP